MLLFSSSVISNSLWPHGPQHTVITCPSLSPRVCSNSCPLSQWCHPTVSSSVAPSYFQSSPESGRVFSCESTLHIRCPKCWIFSFSISSSNEYSRLISFRIDWFDLCVWANAWPWVSLLPFTYQQFHHLPNDPFRHLVFTSFLQP